jgi:hypothetical protein
VFPLLCLPSLPPRNAMLLVSVTFPTLRMQCLSFSPSPLSAKSTCGSQFNFLFSFLQILVPSRGCSRDAVRDAFLGYVTAAGRWPYGLWCTSSCLYGSVRLALMSCSCGVGPNTSCEGRHTYWRMTPASKNAVLPTDFVKTLSVQLHLDTDKCQDSCYYHMYRVQTHNDN